MGPETMLNNETLQKNPENGNTLVAIITWAVFGVRPYLIQMSGSNFRPDNTYGDTERFTLYLPPLVSLLYSHQLYLL